MFLVIFLISLMLAPNGGWQIEKGWNGILPLRSTRSGIEAQLKDVIVEVERNGRITYRTDSYLIHANYSSSGCFVINRVGEEQLLPIDTMVSYEVQPAPTTTISDILWTRSNFERTKDIHVARFRHYDDQQRGISMETYENDDGSEVLRSVSYFLPSGIKVKCD